MFHLFLTLLPLQYIATNVRISLFRIPKLGAVPTVLTLVVAFSSHNVQALPQFGVFPGKIAGI